MLRYRVGRLGRPTKDRASTDPYTTATDKQDVKHQAYLQHRYIEGFKLLDQSMDSTYNALYASQDAPGPDLEPRDEGRYHRLCPQHRKPLDPEGRCGGHKPRRWHVGELLPNKSWKLLYRDVC